jgi:hypothetical protein
MADDKPNLGLATTYELIAELMARAEVDKTVGKTWPLYTTVGGEPKPQPIQVGE